ncbi:MAG: NfeD family protein [Myxococcaceae bacterium]
MDLLDPWHLWLLAALLGVVVEVKTSGFISLWFAVGAVVAALGAGLGLPLSGQLVLFMVVSIALFAASRTIFQKAFMRSGDRGPKIGTEAMLGCDATVIEALPATGSGTVRINGELWSARSVDGAIEPGEVVRVDSVEGLKLRVRRVQDTPIVVQRQGEKT